MINNETPLFLRALKGESVERPPVWIMRQAGRYLPDFMVLKNKYDFFTRCQTPELATEITLMPIKQIGLDASIIFSDILVIPQAMGINVEMKNNFGPYIEHPIKKKSDIINLNIQNYFIDKFWIIIGIYALIMSCLSLLGSNDSIFLNQLII